MAETETVETGKAVTWGPVRQLAQDISKLYSDKKIFELKEENDESLNLENTTISTKSTRCTDINARDCNMSSAAPGCVYLSRDITAPFRVDKLGQTDNFEKKVLAFEFAYDPTKYNDYLEKKAKPVLTTQYLLYSEIIISNDIETVRDVVYTTEHITRELSNSPSNISSFDECTITNLIESDRSKIRKFWDYGDNGESYYANSTEIAGELYMLIEGISNPSCCCIARVALAGLNNNGNGNSDGGIGKPAPWVNGYVGAQDIPHKFVSTDSPWMSTTPYAVTLTGVSMDKTYKSNSKSGTNSIKGFKPETPGAANATYPPPPIGCSTEFIWPTIGTEGGGSNSFYKPDKIFSETYLHWADWRTEYQHVLTPKEIQHAKDNTDAPPEDDEHFPCYLGEERTGDDHTTYHYLRADKNITKPYQRWIKVDDTTYVRLVPMEFTVEGQPDNKAYLAVPVTVAKILKPKSYQTAIRKRWYDMMYYTLRNIAGYKYKKYIGNEECYRVIGVTWDNEKINNTSYMNPCLSDPDDCSCTKCSYERWKVLNLGGERSATPFIGTEDEFNADSDEGTNAAQMWIWEDTRLKEINKYKTMEDYDILFPELYFERLLCYKNEDLYSKNPGGFVNIEKENKPCECLICHYTSYQTSPINLPWEGGGDNKTCDSKEKTSEITIYNTHAYTFKVLQDLTTFITEYKLYEDEPRDISKLEIGFCYCPATAGNTTGITLMNRTVSYYFCDENGKPGCKEATLDLKIPEIPSYYSTLSINEKASLKSSGEACLLEIAQDLKPYGYSAYIWKAVDIGGYKENRKDIKIEFVHYNPARVCSSGTIMGCDLRIPCDPEDDPLYMYNTNCYTAKPPTSSSDTATVEESPWVLQAVCPNEEGSILAFNYNRGTYMDPNTDQIWEEALYWSNEKWVSCDKTPDPAAMASAKIWNRNNEDTAIGTIDIYVAPFFNPASADRKYAKFLGSCNLQRKPPESELENPMQHIGYLGPVVHYACGEIPAGALMTSADQDVTVNNDMAFTADANAPKVIEFEVTHQPKGSKGNPSNYVQVAITIPNELLIDEKTPDDTTYGLDLRQKYIILAARASHTNIHSGLYNSNEVSNDTSSYVKHWATTFAGACRYAEFETAYKFSSVNPS